MQSRSRLCLLAVSILGQSELRTYLFFILSLPLSIHEDPGLFCNQSVWWNAPSLLLWRLNSARCQFEMNCEEGESTSGSRRRGKWAAVERKWKGRRHYLDGGWDKSRGKKKEWRNVLARGVSRRIFSLFPEKCAPRLHVFPLGRQTGTYGQATHCNEQQEARAGGGPRTHPFHHLTGRFVFIWARN